MTSRKLASITAAVLALTLVTGTLGCEHSHGEEEGSETGAVCPSTQTLTYANFGQAFMQSYCLRCHSSSLQGAARNGAPTDHNFDKLESIRSMAHHIDENAGSGPTATNTQMPEGNPQPTLEERRKLSEWLACDAP